MLIFTWHHRQTSAWWTSLSHNIKLQEVNQRSQMWCSFNLICKNSFFWQCYFCYFFCPAHRRFGPSLYLPSDTHTRSWYWKGIIVSVLINFFPLLKIKEVIELHYFFFFFGQENIDFILRNKYCFNLKYTIKDSLLQTADTETS